MKNSEFAVALVVVLVAAGAVGGMLFYFRIQGASSPNQTQNPTTTLAGEAPVWHIFTNVFDTSCNPGNCFSNYYAVSSNCNYGASILTCNYNGAVYYGYEYSPSTSALLPDCNVRPNGVIPQVNGTPVPYLGCILSRAPITQLFSNLYTLSGSGSQISMADSSGNQVIVYPTGVFQSDSCTYQSMGGIVNGYWNPNGSGTLTCTYLGTTYSGVTPSTCNLGTPIQVNGQPVPSDSCVLTRSS